MDVNEKRFWKATRKGDLKVVDGMLKDKIIDPNQIIHGKPVLIRGVQRGNADIVFCALNHGADVSYKNFWALKIATSNSITSKEIIEIILAAMKRIANDDVLIQAVFGTTGSAFMNAVCCPKNEVVHLFLDLIKDHHRPLFKIEWFLDDRRMGPFHYAWFFKLETLDAMIVKLPFARELVNLQDEEGETALHRLAMCHAFDHHIKLLVTKGMADPNMTDNDGDSPLHDSLLSGDTHITETLLGLGCRTDIFNMDGVSPFKHALRKNQRKEIELLLAFGVDLQKEPYLYDELEMPEQFQGEAFAMQRDASGIHPDLLSAMKTLRQWNHLDESPGSKRINSLQRMCRKTIRDHYKPNADEIIDAMKNIPPALKSYLMLENESEILDRLIDWEVIKADKN